MEGNEEELTPDDVLIDPKALGQGQFAVVFRGLLKGTTEVAVKIVKKDAADVDGLRAFYEEAMLVARLPAHPNVISLLGILPDPLMLVFSLAKRGSLLSFVRKSKKGLTPGQELKILRDISNGMSHVAANGVVHRDLAARK